jgi:large subunit ribosomal protein L24e
MAAAKCVFCGREQEDFYGTYLIKNDGNINYYCGSKCYKSHNKLGRDRKRAKWTEAHRLVHKVKKAKK